MRKFRNIEKWTPTTKHVRNASGLGDAFDRWLDQRDSEMEQRFAGWREEAEERAYELTAGRAVADAEIAKLRRQLAWYRERFPNVGDPGTPDHTNRSER